MFRPSLCHGWEFSALPCSQKQPFCTVMNKVSSAHLATSHFLYVLFNTILPLREMSPVVSYSAFFFSLLVLHVLHFSALGVVLTKTIQWNKEGNLQDLAVFWCPVNTQHTLPATITSHKIFSKVQVLWSAVRRWTLLTCHVVWEWNFTCLLVTE